MITIFENPVYRNIQYDPKIWGVSYKALFASLFAFLIGVMVFKSMFGIFGGFGIGTAISLVMYLYARLKENRDQIEFLAKSCPIKKRLSSYVMSSQKIRLK